MHRVDKVFASHLHTDHVGDVDALWIGGWLSGRYTPLHIYGPSGSKPELGPRPSWRAQEGLCLGRERPRRHPPRRWRPADRA